MAFDNLVHNSAPHSRSVRVPRRLALLLIVVSAGFLVWPSLAPAAIATFTNGAGNNDYATTSNWDTGAIPGNGNNDEPRIGSAMDGMAVFSTAGNYTTNSRFLIGHTNGRTGQLTMSGAAGTLTFGGNDYGGANYVGVDGGTGTLNINAGTMRLNVGGVGHLHVGANGSVSTGTVNVGGGALEVANRITLGSGYALGAGNGSGTLTINSGTVDVGTGAAGSDLGFVYLTGSGGSGSATVNLNGGTLSLTRFAIGNATGAKTINFNGGVVKARASRTDFLNAGATTNVQNGGAILDTNGFDITVASSLLGAGSGGLTKQGNGKLALTVGNTYTGATIVNGGTLEVAGSGNFGASSQVTINGGAVKFSRHDTFGNHAADPSINFTVNAGGSITNGNNFTTLGTVTLSGGSIIATGGANGSYQAFSLRRKLTVNGAMTSTIATSGANSGIHLSQPTSNIFEVADGAADVDLLVSGTLINSAGGIGGNSLTKTGAGTMVLSGTNTYTGGTTIAEGTLRLGPDRPTAWYDAADLSTLYQDSAGTTPVTAAGQPIGLWKDKSGATADASQAGAGNRPTYTQSGIGGNPVLTFDGNTQWIVSAFNPNYTVVPNMSMFLVYQKVSDTGSDGLYGHDNGGWDRLQLLNFPANAPEANGISDGGGTTPTPGVITTNPILYTAVMRNGVANGSNVYINGALDATFTENHGNTGQTSLTFGAISTGGAYPSNVKIGEILLYPTNVSPATRAAVEAYLLSRWGFSAAPVSSDFLADTGPVTVAGGTFDLGFFSETVGAVTLQSGSILGPGTLTGSSYDLQSGSVSANLAGSGALNKTTGGTVTLSAATSFTGPTTISAGTLALSGSGSLAGSPSIFVDAGAELDLTGVSGAPYALAGGQTLTGNGQVTGDLNVAAASILSAGTSPGHLTIDGNYFQSPGGTLLAELAGAAQGSQYDWLEVTGNATLGGTVEVNLVGGYLPGLGQSFDILTAAGGIVNTDLNDVTILLDGAPLPDRWTAEIFPTSTLSEALRLTAPVPEPSSLALGLLAVVGLLLGGIRRKKGVEA